MTTEFKTIYAKNKTKLAVKFQEYKELKWEEYTEPEFIFFGLSVKMVIKRETPNG